MPKFRVIKTIPAKLEWVFDVQASSQEEAVEVVKDDQVWERSFDFYEDPHSDYKYEVEVKNN